MCGVCGIFQNSNKKIDFSKIIRKMNDFQSERGPDDEGIFIDEKNGIAFGHRRLSILDLSEAGKQPMNRGNLWITFNGEIYNFLELRKGLEERGYKFKTKTDTEVMLALYEEYKEKSFSMLRGMFAFGLWDGANNKLFLVKDRYGIKPLYYWIDKEKIVFASTVKVIKESGIVLVENNPEALIGFLLFGFIPLPITTIKNVLAVPPGHYLEINSDGEKKIIEYHNVLDAFIEKTKDDFAQAKQRVRGLLEESVNLHLISDAPLGVFLSGGLDSSAIAALAVENYRHKSEKISDNQRLITLSIIFDEPEFSEQKYQQLVAQKIKSNHKEIKIIKSDFENNFNKIFEAMDQPTVDGVNTYFIAKAAKEAGLKTVLSGLGADEIFFGYSHFRKAVMLRKIQKLPRMLKYLVFFANKLFFGNRYKKLDYLQNSDVVSFYLAIRGLFMPYEIAKILGISVKKVNEFIENLSQLTNLQTYKLNNLNPVDLLSYLELKFYLQSQLLKDTDFMSMRHSVEVRVPFLDHKLVEYLSGLRLDIKFKNPNKSFLFESVKELLPQEIFIRPKMGFTLPFQKWLKDANLQGVHWSRYWAKEVLKKFNYE